MFKLSSNRKKIVPTLCNCVDCHSKGTRKSKKKKNSGEKEKRNKKKQTKNKKNAKKNKKQPVQSQTQPTNIQNNRNVFEKLRDILNAVDEEENEANRHSVDEHQSEEDGDCKSSVINHDLLPGSCSSCPSLCDHSQDYGYASAENNNHSNSTSSPDGSDVACSEGFCNHPGNHHSTITSQ